MGRRGTESAVLMTCPGCRRTLGQLVCYKGKQWLQLGEWLVAHAVLRRCACGKLIHFHRRRSQRWTASAAVELGAFQIPEIGV